MSGWIQPFGFTRNELRSNGPAAHNPGLNDIVFVYGLLLVADILTLPLAVLLVFGIGRE